MTNLTLTPTPQSILVAEDEAALRDLYKAVLESVGYLVRTANDGEEAYAYLLGHSVDLLLLDILMPRLNGIALLERLKRDNLMQHVPRIVMLTNLSDDMKIAEALQFGIRGYTVKSSHTPESLLAEVKKYLEA